MAQQSSTEPKDLNCVVLGHNVSFKIEDAVGLSKRAATVAVWAHRYVLRVFFKTELGVRLEIRRCSALDSMLWLLGLQNHVMTGNRAFDWEFRVRCDNAKAFSQLFDDEILTELLPFNRTHTPLAFKRGQISVDDFCICYIEGLYNDIPSASKVTPEQVQLFANELVKIVEKIEIRQFSSRRHP